MFGWQVVERCDVRPRAQLGDSSATRRHVHEEGKIRIYCCHHYITTHKNILQPNFIKPGHDQDHNYYFHVNYILSFVSLISARSGVLLVDIREHESQEQQGR